MTAPGADPRTTVNATRDDLPIWTLDGATFGSDGAFDSAGRQWIIGPDGVKGWSSPAKRRNHREARPQSSGSSRSASDYEERIVTLAGHVGCPSPADREDLETELAALCSDRGRLYPLRRRTGRYDQTIAVEIDGEALIEPVSLWTVKFSLPLAAPDPRKHSWAWQEPVGTPAIAPVSGLDFAEPGLDFSGAGLDFGGAESPGTATVANYGTAPAYPVLALTGPMPSPTVRLLETGAVVRYTSDIAAGETVTLNCDEFPARGFLEHECWSSVRGDVRSLVAVGADWPVVEAQAVATFQCSGPAGSRFVPYLRSAWR